VILVEPPDAKKEVVDGHHRTLANEALGRSPVAYVAKVPSAEGPWLHLHSLQKKGSSKIPVDSSRDTSSRLASREASSRADAGLTAAFAGDLVDTPHGRARVVHSVHPESGAHTFVARAEPAGDAGDGESRLTIAAKDVSPATLQEAEQRAASRARDDSLPREARAACHALALALREHAAKVRSES
jgi:hypothetical protein